MIYHLPYPPSGNNYKRIRRHGRGMYLTKEAIAFHREAARYEKNILHGDVAMSVKLLPRRLKTGKASKRVIDLDNCLKMAADALEGIAYENDKQIKHITACYGEPVDGGGMIVEVTEYIFITERMKKAAELYKKEILKKE